MKNEIDHLEIHPFYGMRAEKAKGWRRIALNLFPLHILLPLVTELKLALTRIRSNRRIWGSGSKDLLVNVGCGGRGLEKWFNVDAFPAPV